MIKKERLYFLDIARGVAILFIVLGHLTSGENNVIRWIYSFHVILFFIISGYLVNLKNSANLSLKLAWKIRTRNIMIPYFTFSIIFIISDFALKGFSITNLAWSVIYTLLLMSPSALWFLPAFFFGEIFVISIIKCNQKYLKIIFIIGCFIIPYIISFTNYNFIMLFISRSLVAAGFIFTGYYIKKILDNVTLFQATILLISTFLLSRFNITVDLYSLQLGNLALYIFNGVLASIGIIGVSKSLNRNKFLEFFGVNTIIIMGTHQWMTRLFVMYFGNDNLFLSLLTFIIIILIEYPIIKFVNNKVPFMLGKGVKLGTIG